MKLHEEFKLWENMWDQTLTEDKDSIVNMVELRRGIKAEIARLEAEKAADTDPEWPESPDRRSSPRRPRRRPPRP